MPSPTRLPQGDADTQRARHSELERTLKQRKLFVDVNVVKTEDWLGADEVYVKLATGDRRHQTPKRKLNDGQHFRFEAPLATLWPLREPIALEVYDEDWPDRDDLIVKMLWRPPLTDQKNTSSMDEADYRVIAQA
ncbi:MAG: hypothetical protein IPK16_14805 [Anaerolineales bacterium]|nr:hypothetical protein [Anaerolineales bacterium]